MSNNLKAGLALIAAVCAGGIYAGYKKFGSGSSTKLTMELAQQILKEIKFQMFNGCVLFAEGVKKNVLSRMPTVEAKREQIKSKITEEALEMFEEKQHLILLKYGVSKEAFEAMVRKHEKEFKKIEEEIENLMLDAVAGKLPDITVPESVKKAFPLEKLFALYRDMLLSMIESMIKAFKKELENPEFNLADQDDYLRVIRSIHVYQLKEKFFTERGFVCEDQNLVTPVIMQTFSKLMEQYKRRDPEFGEKAKLLEKAYEGFVQSLSAKVEQLNFQEIKANFEKHRYSREEPQEGDLDNIEPPEFTYQASSTTQNLANWVHSDKDLMDQISSAIKKGKASGHEAALTQSKAESFLEADVKHDFSKKHVVEEPRPAEPSVNKADEQESALIPDPVVAEPVAELPVQRAEALVEPVAAEEVSKPEAESAETAEQN